MNELKQAFKISLPICFGYIFLGIAFALLMSQEGFPAWASIFSSVFVYAGSMQFALVSFMSVGMSFWMIAVMTLFINARMLFYGVSFIDEFKKLGWKAFYLIFALSDETFSLLVGMKQTKREGSEQVMGLCRAVESLLLGSWDDYWGCHRGISSVFNKGNRFFNDGALCRDSREPIEEGRPLLPVYYRGSQRHFLVNSCWKTIFPCVRLSDNDDWINCNFRT